MSEMLVLELTRDSIATLLLVLAPLLLAALVVGLVVSIFQAVTQVNEATLTFVPKMVVMFVVLLVAGPWMADQLVRFTVRLLTLLPQLAR
ncbi:flagellar biosynthesis protein FliQ [Sphaerobacter thermophilus]|jgi:flagellar biosynthetic protein FliQ|uniref:Flagellar biosynthetic protein FliQ n=1 Tax=Sphaerobacter thermophilus (strain ATCC 49802 / DSM 20745 / KCCM 41009 / NCIMB 13125 / S 6022) TaxID=479434 RepID=D1C197_SPHTD|nr:flagellar biosynthesis protein FliQ [Sphaerobacter thermophilus]ACZ38014.1 flagellar biosynthetic protein FliQ [Sphaerobacter thermophilus DSM 20745]PZN67409.1 MAG: flagellar biosynthetic protein FliQ [Sphaerobacter thermophilus]